MKIIKKNTLNKKNKYFTLAYSFYLMKNKIIKYNFLNYFKKI